MCFQKISIPTTWWLLEIRRGSGGGTEKPKFLKESMKWNFWRGGGLNQETICGGGDGYFLEQQCLTVNAQCSSIFKHDPQCQCRIPPPNAQYTIPAPYMMNNGSLCQLVLRFSVEQGTGEVWSQSFNVQITMLSRASCSVSKKLRNSAIKCTRNCQTWSIHAVSLGNGASCPWQHGNLNVKTLWPNFSCALLNWKS